mmetsp:Transcript_6708/g.22312  ORF Transcript_6708/g.22312 Transcript_6708/m.22312 type:complete len:314 (-) Transcript_6708:770-1711(-)
MPGGRGKRGAEALHRDEHGAVERERALRERSHERSEQLLRLPLRFAREEEDTFRGYRSWFGVASHRHLRRRRIREPRSARGGALGRVRSVEEERQRGCVGDVRNGLRPPRPRRLRERACVRRRELPLRERLLRARRVRGRVRRALRPRPRERERERSVRALVRPRKPERLRRLLECGLERGRLCERCGSHVARHRRQSSHRVRLLRGGKRRYALFENPRLLPRDFREGVPQEFAVIVSERCDAAHRRRRNNVGGVEPPAQAHLEHKPLHALRVKHAQRQEKHEPKVRRHPYLLRRRLLQAPKAPPKVLEENRL